jgi:hypothetical protein
MRFEALDFYIIDACHRHMLNILNMMYRTSCKLLNKYLYKDLIIAIHFSSVIISYSSMLCILRFRSLKALQLVTVVLP